MGDKDGAGMSHVPCVGCGDLGVGRICMICMRKRGRLRERAALCLRMQGMRFREIGACLGVSTERARQMAIGGDLAFSNIKVYGEELEYRKRNKMLGAD